MSDTAQRAADSSKDTVHQQDQQQQQQQQQQPDKEILVAGAQSESQHTNETLVAVSPVKHESNISYLFYNMQPPLDKYNVVTTGLNENGRT